MAGDLTDAIQPYAARIPMPPGVSSDSAWPPASQTRESLHVPYEPRAANRPLPQM